MEFGQNYLKLRVFEFGYFLCLIWQLIFAAIARERNIAKTWKIHKIWKFQKAFVCSYGKCNSWPKWQENSFLTPLVSGRFLETHALNVALGRVYTIYRICIFTISNLPHERIFSAQSWRPKLSEKRLKLLSWPCE